MIVQKSVGCRNVPVEIISGRNQLAGYLVPEMDCCYQLTARLHQMERQGSRINRTGGIKHG